MRRSPVLFTGIRSGKNKDTTVARKDVGRERNREKGKKGGRKSERWTMKKLSGEGRELNAPID